MIEYDEFGEALTDAQAAASAKPATITSRSIVAPRSLYDLPIARWVHADPAAR